MRAAVNPALVLRNDLCPERRTSAYRPLALARARHSAPRQPRLRRTETNQFILEYERGRGRAVRWDLLISTDLAQWTLAQPAVDWEETAAMDLGLGAERATVEIFPRARARLFVRLSPAPSN